VAESANAANLVEENYTCDDFLNKDELKMEDDFAMTLLPDDVKCPCVDTVVCNEVEYCSAFQCPGLEPVYFKK
jgi:hypothetical protein